MGSVGDIIDANDTDGKWYEAVVRFACSSYVCVHYIGWKSRWDEKICAKDSARVAQRGTHTNGPRRVSAWRAQDPKFAITLRNYNADFGSHSLAQSQMPPCGFDVSFAESLKWRTDYDIIAARAGHLRDIFAPAADTVMSWDE